MMTKRAEALGMINTTFRNASGLPNPKQITTARDMATLARSLRHDFPEHYTVFKTPDFTFKGITHRNHNRLLAGFEGTDGLKTGFIQASGFNLVASAVRENRRLVGVVLGGESAGWRDARMMSLFDQAYDRTLPPGDTMVADAAPARKPLASQSKTVQAKATKPKTTPRSTGLIASAEAAATPDTQQGDAATSLAALPPNRMPRTATKPGQAWAIQVGAFSNHGPAQQAANQAKNKLPKTLKGASVAVSPGSDNLFRARLIGLTEKQAQSACKQLTDRGAACITIAPDQTGGPTPG
jgi:D-alanyl-D-alanine carboxypeptidase